MANVSNATRSDDTNGLRVRVESYAARNPSVARLDPPLGDKKTTYGFRHPQLARLLCPAKHISEYDEDPAG